MRSSSLGSCGPHQAAWEATLAVVVGPFLLTALLRGRLEAAHGRRITLTGIYKRKGHPA